VCILFLTSEAVLLYHLCENRQHKTLSIIINIVILAVSHVSNHVVACTYTTQWVHTGLPQ
jgi:hypothetical protein